MDFLYIEKGLILQLTFTPIKADSPLYSAAEALLCEALPADERRTDADQRKIVAGEPRFQCLAVLSDCSFAGFLNLWNFDDFIYIEHLATLPALRNRGIGTAALRLLFTQINKPCVLEADPPVTEIAARRIAFYALLGFELWNRDYIQPAYSKGKRPLHLRLMVRGPLTEIRDCGRTVKTLYKEVYGLNHALRDDAPFAGF